MTIYLLIKTVLSKPVVKMIKADSEEFNPTPDINSEKNESNKEDLYIGLKKVDELTSSDDKKIDNTNEVIETQNNKRVQNQFEENNYENNKR